MNALINEEFDSESEGEDFNPGAEQDEEVADGSEGDEDTSKAPHTNGRTGDKDRIDDDEDGLNGEDGGLLDDEEDEEEEDEDEQDISVSLWSMETNRGHH